MKFSKRISLIPEMKQPKNQSQALFGKLLKYILGWMKESSIFVKNGGLGIWESQYNNH